ncbi:glycoside hydrolase family 16 protein [Sporobolomyces salmoneus]|uniref:glycoside hydrolase family 16 protein n=1 Tax=Sporobolomyces salmoneus TaxID=183962 RepID=UPI00316CF1A3
MYFSPTLVSLFLATTSLVEARTHAKKRCDDPPATALPTTAYGPGFSTNDPPKATSTNTASSPAETPDVPPGGHYLDFSTFDPSTGSAEAFLNKNGYMVSSYAIENDGVAGSIPREFIKSNVDIVDGALRLKITGQSGKGMIKSAEIESYEDVLYGTLETWAKGTPVKGACQGIFFYDSDQAEVDIELLSSYYTEGYRQYLSEGVQFTNQALVKGQDSTSKGQKYGFDATDDFHNYTIQWTEKESRFFIDGDLREEFDTNVPVGIPSKIIYNNWSNGDPKWSAGPPSDDAYFEIKSFKYTPL